MRTDLPKALLATFAMVFVSACVSDEGLRKTNHFYGNDRLCDLMMRMADYRVFIPFITPEGRQQRFRVWSEELYRRNFLCPERPDEPEQVREWRQQFEERRRAEAASKAEEERRRAEIERKAEEERKRAEAVREFDENHKLAEQGDAVLQYVVGLQYEKGKIVEQYDAEAFRWQRLAALQGFFPAQERVGYFYLIGRGVKQNDTEAFRWNQLAAEKDYVYAQLRLGYMYQSGRGVKQNSTEAVRWYRLAAEQGLAEAQYRLGILYRKSGLIERNDTEAFRWFRLAAEQGFAKAQGALVDIYWFGRGVPKDPISAFIWWKLSLTQGVEFGEDIETLLNNFYQSLTSDQVAEANSKVQEAQKRVIASQKAWEDREIAFFERVGYEWTRAQATRKAEEERKRVEAARKAEEDRKRAEAARRAEEERRRAEAARKAEEERKRVKAARKAEEERRRAEAARKAEEDRKRAEAARKAEEERRRKELRAPVLVGAGSSFTISRQGHLLTNHHVIDGCQIVTIHLPSGPKKARVVATDDTNDLALLKTDLEDDYFIPISGTDASLLEDVVVAGYPLAFDLSATVKVTKGVVSSLAGLGNNYSRIQIDAAVQKGNSGGPILNELGNVVAVTVSTLNKQYFLKEKGTIPENTNFGIKSMVARAFVDANGVRLAQPNSQAMSRRDMADLITQTTHRVGCWVSRATAQKMTSDQKQELSVSPTMQRQVEALR
jgi:TPR repeat protein